MNTWKLFTYVLTMVGGGCHERSVIARDQKEANVAIAAVANQMGPFPVKNIDFIMAEEVKVFAATGEKSEIPPN